MLNLYIYRFYLGDKGAKMFVSEYSVEYGCEYFGCNQTLNPQRDKNSLVLVKAISQYTGKMRIYHA